MPGLLELEYESESHDAGLGIRIAIKNFGKMLGSESLAAGIVIVKIYTLESDIASHSHAYTYRIMGFFISQESELESALLESRVPESFTTLICHHRFIIDDHD